MYTEKDDKCIYSDFIICVAEDELMDINCELCPRNPYYNRTSVQQEEDNGSDYETI